MNKTEKKQTICFIMQRAYPIFNKEVNALFGGAEVNPFYLATEFAKNKNNQVVFFVGDYGQKDVEYYNNVKVVKLKHTGQAQKTNLFLKLYRTFMLFKQFRGTGSKVFILSTASEMLGKVALFKKIFFGSKIIFRMAHDGDANPAIWASKDSRFYKMYTYGISKADAIIGQTENQKKILQNSLGLDSHLIKNGFPLNEDVDFSEKKYILWVSRAMPMKRPELFVELARRLKNEKFIIIMPSNDDNSEEKKILEGVKNNIRSQVEKLDNIKLIDFVPFHEIQDYFQGAKLFVNTSEYEGFPNTFIQSGIAKTPILSFNVNPDNIINEYNFGCHCENDMERALEFIQSLDEEKIKHYGEGTFSYVKKHHDIANSIKKYEEIIKGISD